MQDKKYFDYHHKRMAYATVGYGPPLVVLHGWGSSGDVMMPLAGAMGAHHRCYVIDLPGFGASEAPPTGWTVDDYADLVQQFIQKEIAASADLLVHSFGGRIALKLCARSFGQQWVNKVLITGGAGMKPRRSARYYLKKYAAKVLKAPFYLLPASARGPALDNLRQTKLWKSLGSGDYSKLDGVMRETFVKTVTEYLEPCLPSIPHDVLLLWGEDDAATPLYQARRMEEGIAKAAMVTIPRAGHYAFLDQAGRFNAIANAYFKE